MGLENLKSVFNDLASNVKEPVEKISAFEPPQAARVHPDNKSMLPTLQSGKGSQIGTSVFLDATGNSRFSIGEDPTATQPIDFSILDNLPNIARVKPDNLSMIPTLSIGESGLETRFGTISKQGAKPIKLEDLSALDGLPNVAGLKPDNLSMLPTLQSGKGSQIGTSVFLDATGNSRFSIGEDPVATQPTLFSILDNLPNVAGLRSDNLSMSPTLNTGIGLISRHSHEVEIGPELSGVEITTHRENHSALDNIGDNLVERNLLQNNAPINILGINNTLQTVDYTPLVNTAVGINSGLQTFDALLIDNIKKRKFDVTTLGENGRLGEGDFTLGTLFKHNHRGGGTRKVIDTGVLDPSSLTGENIKINTGRAGIGALSKLDIKGYSSIFRSGIGFLKEPYIVHNIPHGGVGNYLQGVGQNRDTIPWRAALDDNSRLAQFYSSPAGLEFIAKENITNALIGSTGYTFINSLGGTDTSAKLAKKFSGFDKITFPPVPVPMTGFLNLLGIHQVQGAGLGSIRKPFTIKYSDKFNSTPPAAFNVLGDKIIGLKKSLSELELKEIELTETITYPRSGRGGTTSNVDKSKANTARTLVNRGLKGFQALANKAGEKIPAFPEFPIQKKPTDLIDTSGPGNHLSRFLGSDTLHGPTDVFAEPGNNIRRDGALLEDEPNTSIKDGDFYVRIRDLREGTLLYFRGYVTGITENVNPSWSPTNYIGRSEPVYNYERAERDLSFNLRVYPQNATHEATIYQNLNHLTSLAYPKYLDDGLSRMKPPFTELYMAHIGTKKEGQFGFIKSLSYTVPSEGDWSALEQLPRLFDISISYQISSKRPPALNKGSLLTTNKFYGG